MRNILLFCLVFISQPTLADALPYWVKELPLGIETVYGLGSAQIRGDKAEATAQAAERAKIELLMSLRTSVDGQLDVHSKSEMAYSKQDSQFFDQYNTVEQKSRFAVNAQDLPGLQVSKTHLDTATGTLYVLAELDLQLAKAAVKNQQDNLQQSITHLKSNSDADFYTLAQLKSSQNQWGALQQLSELLSAHLDASSWQTNRNLQQQLQQLTHAIRQQLRFAWHPNSSNNTQRHQAAVKRAISELGLIWANTAEANFYVQAHAKESTSYNAQYKTTTIYSQVDLSLLDAQGQILKTHQFDAKGVSAGQYIAPAQRQLDQQVQQLTKQTFERWFDGL